MVEDRGLTKCVPHEYHSSLTEDNWLAVSILLQLNPTRFASSSWNPSEKRESSLQDKSCFYSWWWWWCCYSSPQLEKLDRSSQSEFGCCCSMIPAARRRLQVDALSWVVSWPVTSTSLIEYITSHSARFDLTTTQSNDLKLAHQTSDSSGIRIVGVKLIPASQSISSTLCPSLTHFLSSTGLLSHQLINLNRTTVVQPREHLSKPDEANSSTCWIILLLLVLRQIPINTYINIDIFMFISSETSSKEGLRWMLQLVLR